MVFLPLRNSDHVVVLVFIDFPLTSCYLKLLQTDKLQKQICRTVGPSLIFLLSFLAQLDLVVEFSKLSQEGAFRFFPVLMMDIKVSKHKHIGRWVDPENLFYVR